MFSSAEMGSATSSCWTSLAAGHHKSSPSGVPRKLTWAEGNRQTVQGFMVFFFLSEEASRVHL